MSINAPIIQNAVMLDKVIGEIQEGLVTNLSWLDVAFGRAQRLTKKVRGKTVITPNVFCGGWNGHGENDYIEVSPDSKIGNFAYFEVEDPESITAGPWAREISVPFSLVVWFDLRRVYGEASNRNTEYLKAQVLHVLNGRTGWHLTEGRVSVAQIYERVENIYRGYTLSEIDNQFLMHPFAGFRISGVLEFAELCLEDFKPTPIIPDVPTGALQFGVTRFALLDKEGSGKIFRIRGNSAVLAGGTLANLNVVDWTILGYNQIDPTDIVWEQTQGNPYTPRTKAVKVVPEYQYIVFLGSILQEVEPTNFHLVCRIRGTSDTVDVPVEDGVPVMPAEGTSQMFFQWQMRGGGYANDLIVALYDAETGGAAYYRKDIQINITELVGSRNGVSELVFPDGMRAAGNGVRDEIYEGIAVRRVGARHYKEGDELDANLLTNGTVTNYSLPVPEIFSIETDLAFTAYKGGTVFQNPDENPETLPALLDIVIE